MASHPYTQRVNQGGNFCGHYPFAPKLELRLPIKHPLDPEFKKIRERAWAKDDDKQSPKGGIPLVIAKCLERIPQYYSRPRATLPSLDMANGKDRQQRSERREACICLLGALLKYTDLVSLRVGIPTAKGFVSLTVKQLAKNTHMSLKRCERAMADLKAAGLIVVSQPRQLLPDGKWIGLAAVKALSKYLFEVFGLGSMLKIERDKAAKRLKQRSLQWQKEGEGKPTRAGRARLALFLGGKAEGKPAKREKPKISDQQVERIEFERRKLMMLLAIKIKVEEQPGWSSSQCHEEAERRLLQGAMSAI